MLVPESGLELIQYAEGRLPKSPLFMVKLVAAMQVALFASSPSLAELMPPPEKVASPSEQQVVAEIADQLGEVGDNEAALAVLDRALQRLHEPTKLRGYVQYFRAPWLLDQSRHAESVEAIDESIRLLPGYSGPLIVASRIYTYAGRPGEAADFLLRAIQLDPNEARKIDSYEIDALLGRLTIARDDRRAEIVGERLLEIGWVGTDLDTSSSLALQAIKKKISEGDVAGARLLVPKLVSPDHSQTLLINNTYRQIWPDVEGWAGQKLEKQWPIYLNEARARWDASKSPEMLGPYVRALLMAGHNDTVIAEVLPSFSAKLDADEDYDLLFVAASVARALARKGRWQDLNGLYAGLDRVWPLGSDVNALNLAANRPNWLLHQGAYADALKAVDAAIAEARARGTDVNADATATMYLYRACILHKLNRDAEARISARSALPGLRTGAAAYLHLCLDDERAAKQVLIAALSDPVRRDDVLLYVQRSDAAPPQSEFGRMMQNKVDTLRSDPALLSEVGKYGRILPYGLSDSAPKEAPTILSH